MQFLFPWALLGLIAIPILIRLWRVSTKHRRITVPSLIPFESLSKQTALSLKQLRINWLFWLQLLALLLLVLAWTRPQWLRAYQKSYLVVIDTSASMGTVSVQGERAMDRAKERLLDLLETKEPLDSWYLVTNAPPKALLAQPTVDADYLHQIITAIQPTDVGGELESALHIGMALMQESPDGVIVVTDESVSPTLDQEPLTWIQVGTARPNVAIVGLQTHPPLCGTTTSQLETAMANYSPFAQIITLEARQNGELLAQQQVHLDARQQETVLLKLPESVEGWLDLEIRALEDALATDNYARVLVSTESHFSVELAMENTLKRETTQAWLQACKGLTVHEGAGEEVGSQNILLTDQTETVQESQSSLHWVGDFGSSIRNIKLMLDETHPINSYLTQLQPVRTILPKTKQSLPGQTVLWSLVGQERTSLVSITETEGQRAVFFGFDPRMGKKDVAVLTVFLNSLRWLMESRSAVRTGEFITFSNIPSGPVTVKPPQGLPIRFQHEGGVLRWTQTHTAGMYRLQHALGEVTFVANALHPLESDRQNPSIHNPNAFVPVTEHSKTERRHYVSWLQPILWLLLGVLCAEWLLYTWRGRSKMKAGKHD